ncbi:hypothetical protein PENANT_c135G03132 [Penicillium antarcticum]|uniref:Uncharacterized protein n=1 Tax=Penicillium antarcticum TaxID=416450 RepID=A0A1V6PI98_9EURO|nr:hypothetical protein PENANT_c135G03132 [Penicillium antarcticum]
MPTTVIRGAKKQQFGLYQIQGKLGYITAAKIESGRRINTLDRRAAKCRYQHAEPSLAAPLDALTPRLRSLTHETLQRYSSAMHCALMLGAVLRGKRSPGTKTPS